MPSGDAPRRDPGGFPVVGVIGGGQLARMMQGPAVELGVQLSVLAEAPDAAAALVVPSAPVGSHTDLEAVLRVRPRVRRRDLRPRARAGRRARRPGGRRRRRCTRRPAALRFAQDKLAMRERLGEIGVAVPALGARPHGRRTSTRSAAEVGWPVVAKTPRGGYDGKGVRVVRRGRRSSTDWLARGRARPGPLADGVLARGAGRLRPRARRPRRPQPVRPGGGLAGRRDRPDRRDLHRGARARARTSTPPWPPRPPRPGCGSPGSSASPACSRSRCSRCRGRGDRPPAYLVNELAMRPHNSGHWSMDGAVTGQFEQHLRAVLDLPLGAPSTRGAVDGDGQRPRRATTTSSTAPTATSWPATRGSRCTSTARRVRPGPQDRARQRLRRASSPTRASRATHAADYIAGAHR